MRKPKPEPILIRYRNEGPPLARIYPSDNRSRPFNVYWRERHPETGKMRSNFKNFATKAAAEKFGKSKANELHNNGKRILTPVETKEALAAFDHLQKHFKATGKRVELDDCVKEYIRAVSKLDGHTLTDAVDGFLTTAVSVKRKGIAQAVEDFIALDVPRTKSVDGKRPEIGAGYLNQKKSMLLKFANLFPNYAVCDLSKTHVDLFFKELPKLPSKRKGLPAPNSAKIRNHNRGALKQFFTYSVRNDLLSANHRLNEAESMRSEEVNTGDTEFYNDVEFRTLLEAADERLRLAIAICGLSGMRTAELLRLDWHDVNRVPNHIQLAKSKTKTRKRRLVEIVPALAAWLEPYRALTSGKVWDGSERTFQERFLNLCNDVAVKRIDNVLRHAFVTYHYALHNDENYTAAQAGHEPGMVHSNYRGLAVKSEAEKWFNVRPAKQAANVIPLESGVAK